jgi:hypothetical protein
MDAQTLLQRVAADGVTISATPAGEVKVRGGSDALNRWRPVLRERKPEILAALVARDGVGRHWVVRFAGREPLEVIFSQPLAADDVRKLYPTASAQPAPSVLKRRGTDAEIDELTGLVATVYANDTAEERDEALAVALRDCESALICYRLLARCTCEGMGFRN